MGNFDITALGVVIAVLSAIGSFALGRWLRRKRMDRQRGQRDAAARAGESRQVRRARERAQRR